jgi:hypothetical protein
LVSRNSLRRLGRGYRRSSKRLAVVFTFLFCAFVNLYKHDRELLERRLRSKERIREQRVLVRLLRQAFFAVLLLPGFDYRLGWSRRAVF